MSSAHKNTVLDFDFDFLNVPQLPAYSELEARAEKYRNSLIFLKQRLKNVDLYVTHFHKIRKVIQEKKISEIQLMDRCDQQLIELRGLMEKETRLENELQATVARERGKSEKITELENQVANLQMLQNQFKYLALEKNRRKFERKYGKTGATTNNELVKVVSLHKKEIEELRKEKDSLKKELESLRKNITTASTSEKIDENIEIVRSQKLDKEKERRSKENAKISALEREIEILYKNNAELSKMKKEFENLQKGNAETSKLTTVSKSDKIYENFEIARIKKLEKERLCKENAEIPSLEREMNKTHANISELGKEIQNLEKINNAKVTNLTKQIESLRKENAKFTNLEKNNETLRVKIAKFEMEKRALRKEIDKLQNKEENILTHLTPTTNEKGKLPNKLPQKYKSPPDRNAEWCDHSKAKNSVFEDTSAPPTLDGTITARKSPIANKDVEVPRDSDNDCRNEVLEPTTKSQKKRHSIVSGDPNQAVAAREVTKCADTSDKFRAKKRTKGEQERQFLDKDTQTELRHIFPGTPGWPEVDSTSSSIELQKKRLLCERLTKEIVISLLQLSLRLDEDPNCTTIEDLTNLIVYFDSSLKSISYPESTTSSSDKQTQDKSRPVFPEKNRTRMPHDDNNSITITKPSSSHTDTNIVKHKQVEKCVNMSMDESQTLNNSVSQALSMSIEISDVIERGVQSPITNSVVKNTNNQKITEVGMLKKKLKPDTPPWGTKKVKTADFA